MLSGAAVTTVAYGRPALDALAMLVDEARGDDPLAPLTVVTPSAQVARTVRRSLARRGDGLVNVRWTSLPALAGELAGDVLIADGRPPLSPVLRRGAVRAVLFDAGVVDPPLTTVEAHLASFAELDRCTERQRAALAATGGHVATVLERHRELNRRLAAFSTDAEVVRAAVARVRASAGAPNAGAELAASFGPVVVHLPTRLDPAEVDLLAALAGCTLLAVLVGCTGDPEADTPALELASTVGRALGVSVEHRGPAATPSRPTLVVRAPDPDEEARQAVRRIVTALAAGIPAERIGVTARVLEPYLRVVPELLAAAAVPFHLRRGLALAQSVPGRTLLGLLELVAADVPRAALFAWARSAPVLDHTASPPPDRWDHLARRAGVSGGLEQWRTRLTRLAVERATEAATLRDAAAGGDDLTDDDRAGRIERLERDAAEVTALLAWVEHLVALATAPEGADWATLSSWARQVLRTTLGSGHERRHWPAAEQEAYERVDEVLTLLAGLDGVGPPPDPSRFIAVLEHELTLATQTGRNFGHGVVVAGTDELAGADLDLLLVLGASEGLFPPRGQDDPLVPDRVRQLVPGVEPRRPARVSERRQVLAVLASASEVVVSFSRTDPAAGREVQPAPELLRHLSEITGSHVTAAELGSLRHPAFVDVMSATDGLLRAAAPLDRTEATHRALLVAHRAGVDLASSPLVTGNAHLRAAFQATADRLAGRFTRFTGRVPAALLDPFDGRHPASATRLENWAVCPFRYFATQVLDVQPLDEYADAAEISNLDRGSLVHRALELFMAEHLDNAPSAWAPEHRARLHAVVQQVAAEYEADGRSGRRPLLWELHKARLERLVEHILRTDETLRAGHDARPVAVEYGFGAPDGGPPLVIELGGGRQVSFRGSIDRVDRSPDGRVVQVWDYKTGRSDGYGGLDKDCVDAGRHLQLLVYGEAALAALAPTDRASGDDVTVYAGYWFVEASGDKQVRSVPIDDANRRRFRTVLDTIVTGIETGCFPANPGDKQFHGTFENCRYCAVERLCTPDRDDRWDALRRAPEVAVYLSLRNTGKEDTA